MTLYEQYIALQEALAKRECESCGGPAQHVDPDDSTWCHECAEREEWENQAEEYRWYTEYGREA